MRLTASARAERARGVGAELVPREVDARERRVHEQRVGDRARARQRARALARGAVLARAADDVAREVDRVDRAVALEPVGEDGGLVVVEVGVREPQHLDAARARRDERRERVRRVGVEVVVREVERAQRVAAARAECRRAREPLLVAHRRDDRREPRVRQPVVGEVEVVELRQLGEHAREQPRIPVAKRAVRERERCRLLCARTITSGSGGRSPSFTSSSAAVARVAPAPPPLGEHAERPRAREAPPRTGGVDDGRADADAALAGAAASASSPAGAASASASSSSVARSSSSSPSTAALASSSSAGRRRPRWPRRRAGSPRIGATRGRRGRCASRVAARARGARRRRAVPAPGRRAHVRRARARRHRSRGGALTRAAATCRTSRRARPRQSSARARRR